MDLRPHEGPGVSGAGAPARSRDGRPALATAPPQPVVGEPGDGADRASRPRVRPRRGTVRTDWVRWHVVPVRTRRRAASSSRLTGRASPVRRWVRGIPGGLDPLPVPACCAEDVIRCAASCSDSSMPRFCSPSPRVRAARLRGSTGRYPHQPAGAARGHAGAGRGGGAPDAGTGEARGLNRGNAARRSEALRGPLRSLSWGRRTSHCGAYRRPISASAAVRERRTGHVGDRERIHHDARDPLERHACLGTDSLPSATLAGDHVSGAHGPPARCLSGARGRRRSPPVSES